MERTIGYTIDHNESHCLNEPIAEYGLCDELDVDYINSIN